MCPVLAAQNSETNLGIWYIYDGHHVTYHYRSHKTERVERETVEVYTFIGRMVQHVFPKGFQRIRYYGVQATKTFATLKGLMQEALATVKGIVKGAIKIRDAGQ